MEHLPAWFNLKTLGAIVLIGAGLWLLFRTLGEVVKLLIALALIGAGVYIVWKIIAPVPIEEEEPTTRIEHVYNLKPDKLI